MPSLHIDYGIQVQALCIYTPKVMNCYEVNTTVGVATFCDSLEKLSFSPFKTTGEMFFLQPLLGRHFLNCSMCAGYSSST